MIGDALHELGVLGDGMLRLDANGLLGIEREANGRVWWAGHPLSLTANQLIADMVRKLGGFTFEELALSFDDFREMARGGPDLSYDFVTRPAYDDALVTGDAALLRLVFELMRTYSIDPGRLIHALQNHDELTMGLAHFGAHADEQFAFRGTQLSGRQLRELIHREMYEHLIGARAPYNLKFGDGVASTTATVIAATLGIRDISHLTAAQVREIRRLHLLLAFYNAMQPGVFALSGWDLVGALTLPAATVRERLADGDTRWINRGAYDLLGSNPRATRSVAGLPRAVALYGPLPQQLREVRLLRLPTDTPARGARRSAPVRRAAGGRAECAGEGPAGAGARAAQRPGTRLPPSTSPASGVDETVLIGATLKHAHAVDVLDPHAPPLDVGANGSLRLHLHAYEGKAWRIGS